MPAASIHQLQRLIAYYNHVAYEPFSPHWRCRHTTQLDFLVNFVWGFLSVIIKNAIRRPISNTIPFVTRNWSS